MSKSDKILPDLKGRGLFVFSDPGGAKPILALVQTLSQSLDNHKILSDRSYSFYTDFNVVVEKSTNSPQKEIKCFKPDFLFTGTSYTSKIELEYIKAAKELNIPSYAFIDHWTSVRERFDKNGIEILPDKILVIDKEAKEIAIVQGIDEIMIEIIDNPYHGYVKNWKPVVNKQEFLNSIGLAGTKKKIAVYAPDPLSNINGIEIYGFDEITATRKLNAVFENLRNKYHFILQPHPNQNFDVLTNVLNREVIVVCDNINVNTLIFYADVVIGYFSNLLIEASLMNKRVIRFLEKKINNDPLAKKGIGKVVYPQTIEAELHSNKWN